MQYTPYPDTFTFHYVSIKSADIFNVDLAYL